MLNFSNHVPDDPRGNSLDLIRCPTMRAITGIITCEDLVGTRTHYYRGRTIPCDDQECPACSDGFPWRWHSYVSLFSVGSQRTVLFEMTARCTEPLVTYRKAYGTLRGCQLTAKRVNSSPNSRVIVTTTRADLQKVAIPDAPNLLEALSIIWNIDRPSLSVEGISKESPRLSVSQDRAKQSWMASTSTSPSPSSNRNGEGS